MPMLLLLVFATFSCQPGIFTSSMNVLEESPSPYANTHRSVWSIVWSCLTTIILCTWVAMHPNVPSQGEGIFAQLARRIKLMGVALLCPEFIIMWAIRQWLVARSIAAEQKHRDWSTTHGFFVSMGGFALFDGKEMLFPLSVEHMQELADDNCIIFPDIAKVDIEDKGKGDLISKTLVIVQTGWFALQCLARTIQHLPITELEVVTLAFATLNLATYAFWWYKPQNVNTPVQVLWCGAGPAPRRRARPQFDYWGWFHDAVAVVIGWSDSVLHSDLKDSDRVPTFHSGPLAFGKVRLVFVAQCVAGIVFGAIHCSAWAFIFPSWVEMTLWRVAALIVTVGPLLMITGVEICIWHYNHGYSGDFWVGFGALGVILYIASRAVLLILPILLLRSLSPKIFQTVDWTTYIPHI